MEQMEIVKTIKKYASFFFILHALVFFAQKNPIESVEVNHKNAKGTIGGKPITMYLENIDLVECSINNHFIKGWYFYDEQKIKIPLYGYSDTCELYLFNLGDEQNKITPLLKQDLSLNAVDEFVKKAKNKEELRINRCEPRNTSDKSKNIHEKNGKTVPIIINEEDLFTHTSYEYYTLPNGKKIDLLSLFNSFVGHQFLAKKDNRILFTFQTYSNSNCQGACGASEGENGYRIIYLDKKGNVAKTESHLIISCLENIYGSKLVKKTKDYAKYKILIDDKFSHYIIADRLNATLQKTLK